MRLTREEALKSAVSATEITEASYCKGKLEADRATTDDSLKAADVPPVIVTTTGPGEASTSKEVVAIIQEETVSGTGEVDQDT